MNNLTKSLEKLVLFVFGISIFSTTVLAAGNKFLPDMLENWLEWLFVKLPVLAIRGDSDFIIFAKVIIGIMLWCIFYFGTSKIFTESRNISLAVSFVFALMGTILIPSTYLTFLFSQYSTIIAISLGILPVFLGLFLRSLLPVENKFLRGLIMLASGMVGVYFATNLYNTSGFPVYATTLSEWITMGSWAAIIFGTISMFASYGSSGEKSIFRGGSSGTDSDNSDSSSSNFKPFKKSKKATKELKKVDNLNNKLLDHEMEALRTGQNLDSRHVYLKNQLAEHQNNLRNFIISIGSETPLDKNFVESELNSMEMSIQAIERELTSNPLTTTPPPTP